MKIVNEQDALAPLRRALRTTIPTPDGRLEQIFKGTIPAVKKFVDQLIAGESEMALFVSKEHCWFFGNALSIRSTIHAPGERAELTCYKPARDFGPITITRDGGDLRVLITGPLGREIAELDESGWEANPLEGVLPFLLGYGGGAAPKGEK